MPQKTVSYITRDELERRTHQNRNIIENPQQTCPSAFDLYNIDRYTEIRAPQNNPYGMTGNFQSMKRLELQLPQKTTTLNNPFNNVLVPEYGENPNFSSGEHCGEECKQNYYKKMIKSPDDEIWKRNSRQFITTPVSSVPNEQNKFAEWLYGKNYVCKSGSIFDRFGYPFTPDSLVCDGNNASSPEHAGEINNNYGTPAQTNPQASFWSNSNDVGYGLGGLHHGSIPPPNLSRGSPYMNPQNVNYHNTF
jgi:hypothetical protein